MVFSHNYQYIYDKIVDNFMHQIVLVSTCKSNEMCIYIYMRYLQVRCYLAGGCIYYASKSKDNIGSSRFITKTEKASYQSQNKN